MRLLVVPVFFCSSFIGATKYCVDSFNFDYNGILFHFICNRTHIICEKNEKRKKKYNKKKVKHIILLICQQNFVYYNYY
jgi:hypothetical protein